MKALVFAEDAVGESEDLSVVITVATPADAPAIAGLLAAHPTDCVALSVDRLLEWIPVFAVARPACGGVVGAVGLRRLDVGRVELRGLAVAGGWRRRGVGRRLAHWAIARGQRDGLEVVCVTRRRSFFASLGFVTVPLSTVPAKPELKGRAPVPGRVAMSLPASQIGGGWGAW